MEVEHFEGTANEASAASNTPLVPPLFFRRFWFIFKKFDMRLKLFQECFKTGKRSKRKVIVPCTKCSVRYSHTHGSGACFLWISQDSFLST